MDRAHGLTKKTTARNRFADFAYKPKKSTKIPLGLEITTAPLLEEIPADDSSLADSVAGLMAQAKARHRAPLLVMRVLRTSLESSA